MTEDEIGEAAIEHVESFIESYQSAAIPALIGACVLWTVEHGAPDLIRETLGNAIKLADTMETGLSELQN